MHKFVKAIGCISRENLFSINNFPQAFLRILDSNNQTSSIDRKSLLEVHLKVSAWQRGLWWRIYYFRGTVATAKAAFPRQSYLECTKVSSTWHRQLGLGESGSKCRSRVAPWIVQGRERKVGKGMLQRPLSSLRAVPRFHGVRFPTVS